MKRKFISALLFGAMLTASTSTFVSCKDYDDDITELRNQIGTNATNLTELVEQKLGEAKVDINALETQISELEKASQKANDDLLAELQKVKDNTAGEINDIKNTAAAEYEKIKTLQANVANLEAAKAQLEEAVAGLRTSVTNAENRIAKNESDIISLLNSYGELDTAVKAAQARADEAYRLAQAAQTYAEGVAADLENFKKSQGNKDGEQDGKIEVLGNNITSLQGLVNTNTTNITTLTEQLSSLKSTNEAAIKALNGRADALHDSIEANKTAAENAAKAAKAAQDSANLALKKLESLMGSELADVATRLTNAETTIDSLKKACKEADKKLQDSIDVVAGMAKANATSITNLQNDVREINKNIAYEGKRLKSLVFAPTTYVDGIECIRFATLQYKDWGKAWEADAPVATNKNYVIDDAEQLEEYLANPKNVLKSDIVSLSFISNNATNTRAVSESAPIAISKWDIANGVMKLNIKKTVENSFGTNRDKFTIVALKATLSNKFLTEEEIKNGEKAEVYSDWARLYETSKTPYIHNKLAHNSNGTLKENAADAHFWNYSTVYNNGTKGDKLPNEFNDKHVVKEVYYEDELDLLSLVEVCDKEGTIYDMEKYGLAYEFHIMDYKLENLNQTEDETNQKHFAKLKEDGHTLVSTARNNTSLKNRDAIGRQPMIQAVLKDVRDANKVKVVDVRYFKIKWIDKIEVKTYGELDAFETAYKCSDDVSQRVLEQKMNALYTEYNMSRDEFHNKYTLNTTLFASEEEAKKENGTAAANLGTVADQADNDQPGQTHNLLWTINTTNNAATQAEYEAGKKVITAWGYFVDKVNPKSRIVFSIKLTLTINKMKYADGMGKDQTMWNNGARFINPQLESHGTYGNRVFTTTQIMGNFLKGYLKDGQTPATIDDLVNYGDEAVIVFDDAKLEALATSTSTAKTDWTITDDGLTLNYKGVKAAVISGSDIQLYEGTDPGKTDGNPTEGAKLLVGKSAPVKLVDKFCSLVQIIDQYNMSFITPLAITASTKNVEVKDITAGGSNSAPLAGSIEVKEVYTTDKRVVWNNKTGNSAVNNTILVKWYGFEVPVYSTAKAMTNIQKNGTIGSACNVLLSDIKNADGSKKYDVAVSGTGGSTKVTFTNLAGNAIGQEFKIEIPVSIKTKWQDMEAKVIVTVKPNI